MSSSEELVARLSYGRAVYKMSYPGLEDLKTSSISKKDKDRVKLDKTKELTRKKLIIRHRIGEYEERLNEASDGSVSFSD